ncbi:hypothetical protein ABIE44_002181 [Marmoricola sp. OAE513]|uniref:sulfotransferase n=1 Tax=Marmoricola sp. OAE513 TaxID=2817894 RepID=UPI001AE0EC2F
MPRPAQPDFLIIGAPYAGTAALLEALSQHPQVFTSAPIEDPAWTWSGHEAFTGTEAGQVRGGSAPFTLWNHAAHRDIAATLPEVKLISIVRDPVDRAFSNWSALRASGEEHEADFLRALDLEDEREAKFRYRELGQYADQLSHLYEHVDPKRTMILRYVDLVEEPEIAVDRICDFLGVDTGLIGSYPADTNPGGSPSAEQRAAVLPLFAEGVEKLRRVTGQDFGDWLV